MRRDSPPARISPQVTGATAPAGTRRQTPTWKAPASPNWRYAAPRSSRRPPTPRFLRRNRSDLQPHGSEHAREALSGDAFLFQFLDYVNNDFALAADHGDVPRVGRDGPTQHTHIVAVAAGDDDQVAGFIDGQMSTRNSCACASSARSAPSPLPDIEAEMAGRLFLRRPTGC